MTAAIGEAGEGTGTGLEKKRANFTSFNSKSFACLFEILLLFNGVTGLEWKRTLYHRKLAMDTSKKVVGKRKGHYLLFYYRLPMDLSTHALLLLLAFKTPTPTETETQTEPGKAAEREPREAEMSGMELDALRER